MSIIMLTVATLAGEPALADGPEIGQDAGAFFPLENDSIQLVAEEVEIYLPSSLTNPVGPAGLRHGLAKCTYHLRNLTATAQEFAMAFVIQGPAPSWMQTDANFRVEMSGEELPVRYVPLDKARWEGLDRFEMQVRAPVAGNESGHSSLSRARMVMALVLFGLSSRDLS